MKTNIRAVFLCGAFLSMLACAKESVCTMIADIAVADINDNYKELSAQVTGGLEPYRIEWENAHQGSEEATFTVDRNGDLNGPGVYYLEVTDFTGCKAFDTINVKFDSKCPFQVEIIISGGSTTTLVAQAQHGLAPYTYAWSTGDTDSTITVTNPMGEFRVTVTDILGCQVVSSRQFGGCPTIAFDRYGNQYDVVSIAGRCWTKQNIYYALIPIVTDNNQWESLTSPAATYYENDPANLTTYGLLINGYALSDTTLCPQGWHIPTDAEWQTMVDFLGGSLVAGKALKADTSLWLLSNEESNTSGFSALPGGRRQVNGDFIFEGSQAHFWSSTETQTGSDRHWYWGMSSGVQHVNRLDFSRKYGLSCRCIRN